MAVKIVNVYRSLHPCEKMCVFNFSKLAVVFISYHCGAWYAFHTIAEMV